MYQAALPLYASNKFVLLALMLHQHEMPLHHRLTTQEPQWEINLTQTSHRAALLELTNIGQAAVLMTVLNCAQSLHSLS